MAKPRRDAYQEITNRIIELIESGQASGDWSKPWRVAAGAGLPSNAVTKRPYRGVNVMVLWAAAMHRGFEHNLWASYRQWAQRGAQVRGGEKGELVLFFRKIKVKAEEDDPKADDDGKVERLVERLSTVFNAGQVDGFELPEAEPETDHERQDNCDRFIAATGADISHNAGIGAAYSPGTDRITMPRIGLFESVEAFYTVLFHELTHWTGHPDRLDRKEGMVGRFGDESYAMEELVAELGATFICAEFGLEPQLREDHAEYVAHWLTVLRRDKKAIVTAASKGTAAAEYLYEAASYNPAVEAAVA